MNSRVIHRTVDRPNRAIGRVLELLALAEVAAPGQRFLAASPWITDFPIIDNRSGTASALESSWPAARITFSEFLRTLLRRGVQVSVASSHDIAAADFLQRLEAMAVSEGTDNLLRTRMIGDEDHRKLDHGKALIADNWALYGSMNLTFRGVEVNGELVTVTSEQATIAELAMSLGDLFT